MKTHVEFCSDRFPAYEGESDEINPGIFGKRLAEFLSKGLSAEGFETEELGSEDWGWYITVKNQGFRLWIGCANYEDEATPGGFLCFIEPHEPVIRRFLRKVDTSSRVESLQTALDKILSEANGIRQKRWWTYEEFNSPNASES
jgi:hypothetical protein